MTEQANNIDAFIPAETTDPAASRIAELEAAILAGQEREQQLEAARASQARIVSEQLQQQDKLAQALMIVLGDPLEALIECKIEDSTRLHNSVEDMIQSALNDFDICEYQTDVDHMIDERLNERLGEIPDEEDRQREIEETIKELIAGASVSIDL